MKKRAGEKKLKNKRALLLGIAAGLAATLFIGELFQSLIAFLAGAGNFNFTFSIFGFSILFDLPETLNIFIAALVLLSPLLLMLLFFEFGMKMLKSSALGITRYSAIIFEMIIIGFLIVNVFYGAIAVVLQLPENDWVLLLSYFNFPIEGRVIFMFSIILVIAAYLNIATKRVINYINA